MSGLQKFYCKKNKNYFETDKYETKTSKNNKTYLLGSCTLCEKKHVRFIKKDSDKKPKSIEEVPKLATEEVPQIKHKKTRVKKIKQNEIPPIVISA